MKAVKFCHLLLMAAFMSLFCACEHKPLYVMESGDDDPTLVLTPVYIDFDWSMLEEGDHIPEGMTLYAYPVGTNKYKKYDIPTSYDGVVQLPVGNLQLLFVNNDNQNVYTDKYANFLTNQLVLADNNSALKSIYGGNSQAQIPAQSDEPIHITLTPQCMSKHVNVTIINANTVCQQAKSLRALVTGLSNILTINNNLTPDEAESVSMATSLKRDNTTLSGSLRCLSVIPNAYTHKVILAAYDANGGIKAYRFYVTDEVKSQASQHIINLYIDLFNGEELDQKDVDFPHPGKDGFITQIDDFEEEIIDEKM